MYVQRSLSTYIQEYVNYKKKKVEEKFPNFQLSPVSTALACYNKYYDDHHNKTRVPEFNPNNTIVIDTMARPKLSKFTIFMIFLMISTFHKNTTGAANVRGSTVETQKTTMTPEQLEEIEIQKLKRRSLYCSHCTFTSSISCEQRINYLSNKYGMTYLEGLKHVLENGKACKWFG